jgi:hypothetical protein
MAVTLTNNRAQIRDKEQNWNERFSLFMCCGRRLPDRFYFALVQRSASNAIWTLKTDLATSERILSCSHVWTLRMRLPNTPFLVLVQMLANAQSLSRVPVRVNFLPKNFLKDIHTPRIRFIYPEICRAQGRCKIKWRYHCLVENESTVLSPFVKDHLVFFSHKIVLTKTYSAIEVRRAGRASFVRRQKA